ncbi:MAG: AI-2E family transporter [Candidatus Thioglobus sp.]|nr:AI-2E family transporter [Candidatus Thioglobus sp.]
MKNPFENGFILGLLVFAIGGLIWLFSPFIPALFLALLIAIASFSQYQKLQQKLSETASALLMTLLITLILILPLGYILLLSGLEISNMISQINSDFDLQNSQKILTQTIISLPLPDGVKASLQAAFNNNLASILISIKDFSIGLLKSIILLSSNFILFLIITILALYYFYIDGKTLLKRLKNLSPLEPQHSDILLNQFSNLSISLVGSVFIIALLQGVVFSIGVAITGLPVLYFAIAMALASFIPVLGGLIIWLPLSLYLGAQGQIFEALIIVFFGGILVGVIIDNFIRPMIIQKLSGGHSNALNHTFITVLSTLAGVIQFGALGLFIGPIIAAMAISIFDVYALKYGKFNQV